MPFYPWLRPDSSDTPETLKTKRRTAHKLKALRDAFKEHVAAASLSSSETKFSDPLKYVRIATWNIREFDAPSYGYRSREAKCYLAEIIANFDLIALQEIRRDLGPLNDIKNLLGPNWSYIATDVTEGKAGNEERMVFLFNRNRISFRNVAGELTLPAGQQVTDPFGDRFKIEGGIKLELPEGHVITSAAGLKVATSASGLTKVEEDVEISLPAGTKIVLPPDSFIRVAKNSQVPITSDKRINIEANSTLILPEAAEIVLPPNSMVGGPQQFSRTPFIASFQAGWLKINLATVHIYYGSGKEGLERRKEEIRHLTQLLAERGSRDNDTDADSFFIVLGDFNIVDTTHETMNALCTNDFVIPEPLQRVPGSNVKQDKFYDQIALWTGKSKRRKTYTKIEPHRAGVFDYFDVVYRLDEEKVYRPFMSKPNSNESYSSYENWRTYQMSDHLPMWVEFRVDFAEEYLADIEGKIQERLGE